MNDVGRRDFLKQAGAVGAIGAVGGGILGGFPTPAGAEPPEKAIVPPEARLTNEEMDYLKRWDAPTIANALERTKARPRDKGFMTPDIRPTFPELGPMVGYAVTATIKASEPRGQGDAYVDSMAYYEYIQSIPAPRIMVIHDEDAPNPIGSFWGEVHGNLHQALGCTGVITDGGVRDLDAVRALKFHYFAAKVLVSHAYVHLVDFGTDSRGGSALLALATQWNPLIYGRRESCSGTLIGSMGCVSPCWRHLAVLWKRNGSPSKV